jgi:hypothetical protein
LVNDFVTDPSVVEANKGETLVVELPALAGV